MLGVVVLSGYRSPLSLPDAAAVFDDEAAELVGQGDLRPATLPDDLLELQTSSANGLRLVGFYAPRAPIVTVCTGATKQCAAALPTEALLLQL